MRKDTKFSRRNISIGVWKLILKLGLSILTWYLSKKAVERSYSIPYPVKLGDKYYML